MAVLAEVQWAVNRMNRDLPVFERIRRFVVLGREFSIEYGELIANMKLSARILKNFVSDVKTHYEGRDELRF